MAIAQALEKNTTLTSIDLSENSKIGDEGAKAIAKALEKNTTLTSINLEKNTITDKGAKAIAKALKKNTTLTSINLANNSRTLYKLVKDTYDKSVYYRSELVKLGDKGAKAIADALEKKHQAGLDES